MFAPLLAISAAVAAPAQESAALLSGAITPLLSHEHTAYCTEGDGCFSSDEAQTLAFDPDDPCVLTHTVVIRSQHEGTRESTTTTTSWSLRLPYEREWRDSGGRSWIKWSTPSGEPYIALSSLPSALKDALLGHESVCEWTQWPVSDGTLDIPAGASAPLEALAQLVRRETPPTPEEVTALMMTIATSGSSGELIAAMQLEGLIRQAHGIQGSLLGAELLMKSGGGLSELAGVWLPQVLSAEQSWVDEGNTVQTLLEMALSQKDIAVMAALSESGAIDPALARAMLGFGVEQLRQQPDIEHPSVIAAYSILLARPAVGDLQLPLDLSQWIARHSTPPQREGKALFLGHGAHLVHQDADQPLHFSAWMGADGPTREIQVFSGNLPVSTRTTWGGTIRWNTEHLFTEDPGTYVSLYVPPAPRGRWVQVLVSGNSDPTPLEQAINNRDVAAVRALLAAGVDPDEQHSRCLISAIMLRQPDLVEALLEAGADPTTRQATTRALYLAAHFGDTRIAELLLDHGARINDRESDSATALHMAALRGHEEMVRLLLARGAYLPAQTQAGQTAWDYANAAKHLDLLPLLVP